MEIPVILFVQGLLVTGDSCLLTYRDGYMPYPIMPYS